MLNRHGIGGAIGGAIVAVTAAVVLVVVRVGILGIRISSYEEVEVEVCVHCVHDDIIISRGGRS